MGGGRKPDAASSVRSDADADGVDWASWTDWLALTGGVPQGFGLGLTVREIIRTEDRTFPERKHRVRRLLARVRALVATVASSSYYAGRPNRGSVRHGHARHDDQ